jgi:hypothetical protein
VSCSEPCFTITIIREFMSSSMLGSWNASSCSLENVPLYARSPWALVARAVPGPRLSLRTKALELNQYSTGEELQHGSQTYHCRHSNCLPSCIPSTCVLRSADLQASDSIAAGHFTSPVRFQVAGLQHRRQTRGIAENSSRLGEQTCRHTAFIPSLPLTAP